MEDIESLLKDLKNDLLLNDDFEISSLKSFKIESKKERVSFFGMKFIEKFRISEFIIKKGDEQIVWDDPVICSVMGVNKLLEERNNFNLLKDNLDKMGLTLNIKK